MSLRNGNEYFPKPWGAEVYDWNESAMQYQGQREERTQLLERNGAKMEIIYCKHSDKQITTCFLFSAQLLGGGEILRFFGQRSGAKR